MALARPTVRHGPITMSEADRMDLSVIAALMGVGEQEQRQQAAWEQFAVVPSVPMVRKSKATPPAD